jgi:hypothetical protein
MANVKQDVDKVEEAVKKGVDEVVNEAKKDAENVGKDEKVVVDEQVKSDVTEVKTDTDQLKTDAEVIVKTDAPEVVADVEKGDEPDAVKVAEQGGEQLGGDATADAVKLAGDVSDQVVKDVASAVKDAVNPKLLDENGNPHAKNSTQEWADRFRIA